MALPVDKHLKTLEKFGWDISRKQVEKNIDFFDFIRDSRILYNMRGYQKTAETSGYAHEGLKQPIRFKDDQPCFLVKNAYRSWADFKDKVEVNPATKEIFSKNNSEKYWNYFLYPKQESSRIGLNSDSRFRQVRPVYALSDLDKTALGLQERHCACQLFTSNNSLLSKVSHVGLRLIDQNGLVYSCGLETLLTEPKFTDQAFLGTYNATITSLDYDEFAPFTERRVTTFAISDEQFAQALVKVQEYAGKNICFNRARQNCLSYSKQIAKIAGLPVPETLLPFNEALWMQIKETSVGSAIDKIVTVVGAIFAFIADLPIIGLPFSAIGYVLHKIATMFNNLIFMSFGFAQPIENVPEGAIDEPHQKDGDLTWFTSGSKGLTDLFNDETCKIDLTIPLVNWQLKDLEQRPATWKESEKPAKLEIGQGHTIVYQAEEDGPRFFIAPTLVTE